MHNDVPETQEIKRGKVALLSFGHLINDTYSAFLAPILPLLITQLKLSLTLAGLLASVLSFSASVLQPLYGILADKFSRRYFVYLGPLITSVFMCLVGLAHSHILLALLLFMSGVGTAAFHPLAATLTAAVSGNQKGLGMSVFVTSGNLGFSIGPVIIVSVVALWGLEKSYLTVLPGLLISFLLYKFAPSIRPINPTSTTSMRSGLPTSKVIFIGILTLIVIFRALVVTGFNNFVPLFLKTQGHSFFLAGTSITFFMMTGSIGALVGGYISDKIGRKKVLMFSLLGCIPFLIAFVMVPGIERLGFLALAGLLLYASIPVNVIMAQEIVPKRTSTASAFMMGFGWGIGGLLMIPLGYFADTWGVARALTFLAFVPLAAMIATLALPETRTQPGA